MKNITVILCLSVSIFFRCSDENPHELIGMLNGTWTERYHCSNYNCTNLFDSLQSTVLEIDDNDFTSTHYKDSAFQIYDTSFSGKISISSDTLQFIFKHFKEIFS
jgi:hypothetical protein